ncbi:transmembrane 220 family protein [Aestuariivivens sediminis]|uniref:transmembrane 220 family protein n=1 Tax=Aestuariivivens sediminis TaxID=2913557 RepID=UPI001F58BFE8|nr:transmembrane 220 family protein [Aestuariivivens sediminis]
MLKIVNYTLFVIFVCFALLQLNDPDGWIWFFIYFLVAAICLLQNFISIPRFVLVIVGMGLLAYAAFHISLFLDYLKTEHKKEIFGAMVYEKPYLEGTREFIGLLIAAAAILYQTKSSKS